MKSSLKANFLPYAALLLVPVLTMLLVQPEVFGFPAKDKTLEAMAIVDSYIIDKQSARGIEGLGYMELAQELRETVANMDEEKKKAFLELADSIEKKYEVKDIQKQYDELKNKLKK
ncbi:hypothetical protein [Effusibacillus pohliae]|uniref:hypothetical protein n=1 Tax=Effusibacillus pohliae TaxID=232270 RepID=UPI00036E5165|nr:hypothetical protein [Effusibacillus pohliae]